MSQGAKVELYVLGEPAGVYVDQCRCITKPLQQWAHLETTLYGQHKLLCN